VADGNLALIPVDDGLDMVAGNVVAGDLDLAEQLGAKPHVEHGVVEVFLSFGECLLQRTEPTTIARSGKLPARQRSSSTLWPDISGRMPSLWYSSGGGPESSSAE